MFFICYSFQKLMYYNISLNFRIRLVAKIQQAKLFNNQVFQSHHYLVSRRQHKPRNHRPEHKVIRVKRHSSSARYVMVTLKIWNNWGTICSGYIKSRYIRRWSTIDHRWIVRSVSLDSSRIKDWRDICWDLMDSLRAVCKKPLTRVRMLEDVLSAEG